MPPRIIDLSDYRAETSLQLQKIREAENQLRSTHRNFAVGQEEIRLRIIEDFEKGMTTGSILHDQLMKTYGLDNPTTDLVLTFDQKMVSARGQFLLMCASFKVPLQPFDERYKTLGRENQFRIQANFVLGKLNGNHLAAILKTKTVRDDEALNTEGQPEKTKEVPATPDFVFPFDEHVLWETTKAPNNLQVGAYTMNGCIAAGQQVNQLCGDALLSKLKWLPAEPREETGLSFYIGPIGTGLDELMGPIVEQMGAVDGIAMMPQAKCLFTDSKLK